MKQLSKRIRFNSINSDIKVKKIISYFDNCDIWIIAKLKNHEFSEINAGDSTQNSYYFASNYHDNKQLNYRFLRAFIINSIHFTPDVIIIS